MFIKPEDRRLGNRRQQLTRQRVASRMGNDRARRQKWSKYAKFGDPRNARMTRPFRSAAGARMLAGGSPRRAGGLAEFLQGRGRGQDIYFEPPFLDIPEFEEPENPEEGLPGDPPIDLPESPQGLPFLRDLMGDVPRHPELLPIVEQLRETRTLQSPTPDLWQELLTSPIPTQPIHELIAGLVPLGGGTWFDPNSGSLHGPSQLGGGLGIY